MSQRYLGGVITANPTTPTLTTESGVWTLEQQFQYSSVWSPKIIGNSVRLRASASAYFNRTPGSTSNRRTFTWSCWLKLGALDSGEKTIFASRDDDTASGNFFLLSVDANKLRIAEYASGYRLNLIPTQVMRDPSAWYHLVLAVDTTQATSSDRAKVYVNGTQITSFSTATYPSQNVEFYMNVSGQPLSIGTRLRALSAAIAYYDGYLAEVNFIDGQALTPASFGAFDTTGVWQPLAYTGTYGTNGFYLTFADNSGATATTIGKDYSGNGNNWTPNNISVTAGSTYDWMLDSPTNWTNGTGNGVGNYCTLNPAIRPYTVTSVEAISAGNLQVSNTGSGVTGSAWGTFNVTTGKWYYEATVLAAGGAIWIGVSNNANAVALGTYNASLPSNGYTYRSNGNKCNNSTTGTSYGATYTTNDVIGVALDADSSTIEFFKNGVSQGVAYTGISSTGGYSPGVSVDPGTTTVAANFGQRPFSYTPPTGFKALNTLNLPDPTIMNGAQYMAATTYTGNGGTQTITNTVNGVSMQPDLVWLKTRSAVSSNLLYDTSRGVLNYLSSNQTAAEASLANSLTAFNSNGFTLGSDNNVNQSTVTFVGWQWLAGRGTTSSNTAGSITSTVSVNTTAGFSIVTYTGTGSNATVGHGLGVAPSMIITKRRNSSTEWWPVYHRSIGNTAAAFLNVTNAPQTTADFWNNTTPTSSVFSVGIAASVNGSSGTQVAYCFAQVAGYSSFGSYTGNGSADGPFVFTGFRPRWVLIKQTNASGFNWNLVDTSRSTYNEATALLSTNTSDAEVTSGFVDVLSNGFKVRNASGYVNANGGTYIYAAFAENPFKIARAR